MQEKSERVTLAHVAEAAGVAESTVSRAFTRPSRVNPATRQQVLAVAEELGYAPNPAARALGSGRTRTLALLVPDIGNPYFAGVIKGAEQAAAASDRTLVLADTRESPAAEAKLISRLGPQVDGLVISAPRSADEELTRVAEHQPLVLVNRELPDVSCVIADYHSGTRQIVQHLASLGHRSMVFLAGPAESWSGVSRWRGLQAAAADAGLSVCWLGPYAPTMTAGPAAADALIGSGATAAVCHNDVLAIGVMRRLAGRGVRVPEEVSVVGFDNIFGADICTPGLTTLAEHTQNAGARAVETLLQLTGRPDRVPPSWLLPTQLIIRGSTGRCAERLPGRVH